MAVVERVWLISLFARSCIDIFSLAITCQSLDYEHDFMTMTLSYDPLTRITSGFLAGEVDPNARGPVMRLLDRLKRAAAYAPEPMLLPILTYSIWCDDYCIQVRKLAFDVAKIQAGTGLMDTYLKRSMQYGIAITTPGNYNTIHKDLVVAHASLTNDFSRFVEDLGKGCDGGLGLLQYFNESSVPETYVETHGKHEKLVGASGSPIQDFSHQRHTSEAALRSYLDYWLTTARVNLQLRDQQLARVNMQLQVVRLL